MGVFQKPLTQKIESAAVFTSSPNKAILVEKLMKKNSSEKQSSRKETTGLEKKKEEGMNL